MGDEVFCLFMIFACLVTLAMPAVAEPMFAVFAAAIVMAARIGRGQGRDVHRVDRGNREVPGRGEPVA